jgi:uncharacterized membrane protein YhhN
VSTGALAVAIAATVAGVVAVAALLAAERADRADRRRRAKPAASLAFLIVGAATGAGRGGLDAATAWIGIGLVLGAIGDVALMYPGDRPFLIGLGAFLAGHVAYVIAFARQVPIDRWPHAPLALTVPVVVAALGALAWLWRHLGSMKLPVIAYVAVITTMVIGAIACEDAGRGDALRSHVATAGALLFYASDLSVARDRFVRPGFVNRAWGLPAYYAAQLLFAWSVS